MFNDKTIALVTGAATGIGRETAMTFGRLGCTVVVADLDVTRGPQVADAIRQHGAKALFVATDVSDPAQVAELHQRIITEFGRLDIACNNAGIEGEQAPTAETTLNNFDRVLAINLRGVFLCMQEQLKIMLRQKSGTIVNVASVAGLVGFAGLPAYCASKGGVVQLTRTAAVEYAPAGIRINAVCPGAIKTEMIDRITDQDAATEAQFVALHPMNRMGTVQEVAAAIVWLASPAAGFVTGHALPVDGGLVAR